MEWFEYLILISAILFVLIVFTIAIKNKLQGKGCDPSSCNGSCSCCKHKCKSKKQLLEEYRKMNTETK